MLSHWRADSTGNSSSSKIQLQIGDVCCSVTCDDEEVLGNLGQLYFDFLSDQPVDFSIDLHIVQRFSSHCIAEASSLGNIIRSGSNILVAYWLTDNESANQNHTVSCTLERHQFNPHFDFKIMNLLLPLSYYEACRTRYSNGCGPMLVHSCGIIRHGRLMMFSGPSDTGKTTIAKLCGNEHGQVINDEMLLVSGPDKDSDALMVQGVPIIGGVAQRLNVSAPLACVLLLKQSDRTALNRLNRTEAYLQFMRQVIAPRDFEGRTKRAMLSQVAEFSDMVTNVVPFYELEFTLNQRALWKTINKLEKSLGREGS